MAVDWLVPPHLRVHTPNSYTDPLGSSWRVQPIDLVVLHFTAGYAGEGSARYLANQARNGRGEPLRANASAHFVVSRDGTVHQLAPLAHRTWHAGGRSAVWRDKPGGANPRSIGIEIANLGPLFRSGDGWIDWWSRPWIGAPHPNPLPVSADPADLSSRLIRQWCEGHDVAVPEDTGGAPFEGIAWEPYRPPQLEAVTWIVQTLADRFPFLRDDDAGDTGHHRLAAHSEIDPSRKLDPGPAFPLARLRELLIRGDP